jgi:sugar phosphate isomerase/epimerase
LFTTLSPIDVALDVSFAESVALAAKAGFDAVDLSMEELVDSPAALSASEIEEKLAQAELRAGGWWLPIEYREDQITYEAGLEVFARAVPLAEQVGAIWCNTWLIPFHDELDYAANLTLHVERLRPVAATLGEHGCVLGLEFVAPKTLRVPHPYEFVSTIPQTLELIDAIGEPNVGVLLDCWQWYTSHGTPEELTSLTADQVTYVHVNDAPAGLEIDQQIDNQRMLPGATGVIPVRTFLEALVGMRFDGPVAVEPFNAEFNELEPHTRVRIAMASLSATFAEAGVALA